jgi:pyrimidine operon attenuation protein / uracil phosphoribosyltransferase
MPDTRTQILDDKKIGKKINRIAWQIYENFYREEEIIIAGIADNGCVLASRITKILKEISPIKIISAELKINKKDPLSEPVQTNLDSGAVEGKVIIVVDDVLDSGKTLMYGVHYFLHFKVKELKTVVLIDRSHRLFPVRADFVGTTLATTLKEHIRVEFSADGNDAAYLI